MGNKKFLGILALVALAAVSPADAKPKVDFDQGIDARAALDDAKSSQAPAPAPVSRPSPSGPGCRVDLRGQKLTLKDGFDFARVVYRVDDQCRLIKSAAEYLKKAPASKAAVVGRNGIVEKEVKLRHSASARQAVTTGCTVEVVEKDVIGATMITLDNGTSWSIDNGQILEANEHVSIFGNLDWWFVTGDPTTNLSWIQEGYSAQSQATGGFYCSAVGPISNYVCGTAGYQITLEGDMTFDATGTCSGQYGYSGTVVPLGSVTATLTRN